jgi:hypothetical protein
MSSTCKKKQNIPQSEIGILRREERKSDKKKKQKRGRRRRWRLGLKW